MHFYCGFTAKSSPCHVVTVSYISTSGQAYHTPCGLKLIQPYLLYIIWTFFSSLQSACCTCRSQALISTARCSRNKNNFKYKLVCQHVYIAWNLHSKNFAIKLVFKRVLSVVSTLLVFFAKVNLKLHTL